MPWANNLTIFESLSYVSVASSHVTVAWFLASSHVTVTWFFTLQKAHPPQKEPFKSLPARPEPIGQSPENITKAPVSAAVVRGRATKDVVSKAHSDRYKALERQALQVSCRNSVNCTVPTFTVSIPFHPSAFGVTGIRLQSLPVPLYQRWGLSGGGGATQG